MTTSLLGDAFADHLWTTERLIDEWVALTPEQLVCSSARFLGMSVTIWR
jgi:hypothetical protein